MMCLNNKTMWSRTVPYVTTNFFKKYLGAAYSKTMSEFVIKNILRVEAYVPCLLYAPKNISITTVCLIKRYPPLL